MITAASLAPLISLTPAAQAVALLLLWGIVIGIVAVATYAPRATR